MATIVIRTIASLFPVLLVVLLAVGDEVVEREPVMAGHKIHTLLCFACLMSINFGTAYQSVSEAPNSVFVTTEKTADVISKTSVPLSPAMPGETTHLVQTCGVPCFGNELASRESWGGIDIPEQRRTWHQSARLL